MSMSERWHAVLFHMSRYFVQRTKHQKRCQFIVWLDLFACAVSVMINNTIIEMKSERILIQKLLWLGLIIAIQDAFHSFWSSSAGCSKASSCADVSTAWAVNRFVTWLLTTFLCAHSFVSTHCVTWFVRMRCLSYDSKPMICLTTTNSVSKYVRPSCKIHDYLSKR